MAIRFIGFREKLIWLQSSVCSKIHWCRTFCMCTESNQKKEESDIREKLLKSLLYYLMMANNTLRRVPISDVSHVNSEPFIHLSLCVHISKMKTIIPSSSSCIQWDNSCESLIHGISRSTNNLKRPNICSKERFCSWRLSKKPRLGPFCREREKTVRHSRKGREFIDKKSWASYGLGPNCLVVVRETLTLST